MGCAPSQSASATCIVVEGQQPLTSGVSEESATINSTGAASFSADYKADSETKENESAEGDDNHEYNLESSTMSQFSGKSASSGQSVVSWDSGVYELEDEYADIITEHSDPVKVRMVEKFFRPPKHLELIVEGKACGKRGKDKAKERLDQRMILQMLREEGLIVSPESKSSGGVRFDVVSADGDPISAPVHRLPPLHLREKHKKKKKDDLTYDDIQQKLAKAEERRKQQEEEKLSKLNAKDRLDALTSTVEQQAEENRQKLEEKMESNTRLRENHLREVQERLKAREDHANKVRMRKQMILESTSYSLSKEE